MLIVLCYFCNLASLILCASVKQKKNKQLILEVPGISFYEQKGGIEMF